MWYFLLDFQLRLCLAKCAWQLLMLQHHSTTWMDEWQVNRSGKSSPGDPSVWSQHPMCQHSVGHTLGPWNAGLVSTGPRSMGERQNSKLPLSCTTFFLKKMSHATSEMERSSVAFAKIRRPGPFDGSSQPASLHHSQHNWKDKSRATMGLNGLEGSYQLPFCCGGLPISCQHSIVCHGNMGHFGAPSQSAINPTMMTSLPALLVGPWNGCTSSRLQVPSPCQTAQS